ncbi:hypothetical protein LINPERPRIM_LOCUS36957 [Linum perenne]
MRGPSTTSRNSVAGIGKPQCPTFLEKAMLLPTSLPTMGTFLILVFVLIVFTLLRFTPPFGTIHVRFG